jgi:glycosyltransferase involved in cell wall biosynthesis
MPRSTLYVCYFGLRQPLVQTQVLPYLREVAADGWSVTLLTFEPGWPADFPDAEQLARREALARDGIAWHAHPYTKSHGIAAKVKDIATGLRTARRLAREKKAGVIHGRAHVGTAIACLAAATLRPRPRVLFDIRGFNPEESVDAGRWTESGAKFRLLKRAERAMLRAASGFVILTEAGRAAMFPNAVPDDGPEAWRLPDGRPVQVIPCCVDAARFAQPADAAESAQRLKQELGLADSSRIVVHLGALGGSYPEDRIVALFRAIHFDDPHTGFLILSQTETALFRKLYAEAGLPENRLWTGRADAADVARYLAVADWGLSLKREHYAQLACSPTKVPEYLLAGLPVLASRRIGDTDDIVTCNRVGVVFDAWDDAGLPAAVAAMNALSTEPDIAQRCRNAALERFDLKSVGGPRYRSVYSRLERSASAGER